MKKSQIKLGETIAVLIVFFMLLFFGIFFYANMERKSIQERLEQIEEKRSIDITQIISFLPELKCTAENITKTLCIDKIKLRIFKDIGSQNTKYYQSVFSNIKLEVAEIYPQNTNYSAIYEGTTSDEYFTTHIPVSLFEPTPYPGRYGIGLLKVTYYTFK